MGKAIFCLENKNKKRKKEIKTKEKIIINEKCEDMEEINENIYVGIGIKKMKGYKKTVVREETGDGKVTEYLLGPNGKKEPYKEIEGEKNKE